MVECVEKLAQCSQGFDNFLEFEQKIQILETVVNLTHSVCSVEHALSPRTLVSVVVSTENLNYRKEAEGCGVVWAMELESGRALIAVLTLQEIGKLFAGALKYFIGRRNIIWLKRNICRASEQ